MHVVPRKHLSRLSNNSEANASELLESLEEMLLILIVEIEAYEQIVTSLPVEGRAPQLSGHLRCHQSRGAAVKPQIQKVYDLECFSLSYNYYKINY